jgi:hypothetical protein
VKKLQQMLQSNVLGMELFVQTRVVQQHNQQLTLMHYALVIGLDVQ